MRCPLRVAIIVVTKLALTKGTFKGSASPHVLANLVKVRPKPQPAASRSSMLMPALPPDPPHAPP